MDAIFRVIEVQHDDRRRRVIGRHELREKDSRQLLEHLARDAIFKTAHGGLARERSIAFGQTAREDFEDGILAQQITIVRVFLAADDLPDALQQKFLRAMVGVAGITGIGNNFHECLDNIIHCTGRCWHFLKICELFK